MPYYAFYYAMSLKSGHDVVHKKNWGREAFNNMIRWWQEKHLTT